MAIVGIDLGTTNSLISVFTDDGPVLIPNETGSFMTPSAVGYSNANEIIVGHAAKDRLVTHPEKSAAWFKRHMGSNKGYRLVRRDFRPEDLSALVLKKLKADAETFLGEPVERAVISVPAYFNDVQRKATYAAGKMAGLKVERLINEPTAAALAYGLNDKEGESTFLVVDLGGGTFDVSILEIFDGIMEVRSSAGDAFLGGEDFTDAVFKMFGEQIGPKFEKLDAKQRGLLRDLSERAKHLLTTKPDVTVNYNGLKETISLKITREEFDEQTKKLQSRLRLPIQRAVSDAGLRAENIDRVVLVGGATRMPVIRSMVTRLLKLFPEHSLDPDHVVALGAAVQAGLVDRHAALEDVVMTDVSPFSLGTNVSVDIGNGQYEHGHFQPIIERNTVIPVSRVTRNSTLTPDQKEITLGIYQGESPRVNDNIFLGEMNIKVPLNKKKGNHESFDIRFTYDVSGVLEILVTTLSNNETKRMVIEGNPGSLSQEDITKRLKELDKLKVHPRDKAENLAIIARLKRAYENHLGDIRRQIDQNLTYFETTLAKQNDTDIAAAREKVIKWLEEIDNLDVF
ncbi:MAG: molecular chaperone HscC [Maricaulaceae bacterium]